jgi:hypothetical protein
VSRLLDSEIDRVRRVVFQLSPSEPAIIFLHPDQQQRQHEQPTSLNAGELFTSSIANPLNPQDLVMQTVEQYETISHTPQGSEDPVVTLTKKITIPVDRAPLFNYVGRILGPRGSTVKQLEAQTGCKILVRGGEARKTVTGVRKSGGEDGSDEPLHVILSVQDVESQARSKINAASVRIQNLLTPPPDGMDELKKRQLIELAILNGTYRLPPHLRRPALLRLTQVQPFMNPRQKAALFRELAEINPESLSAHTHASGGAQDTVANHQDTRPRVTGDPRPLGPLAAAVQEMRLDGARGKRVSDGWRNHQRYFLQQRNSQSATSTLVCNEPIRAEDLVTPEGVANDYCEFEHPESETETALLEAGDHLDWVCDEENGRPLCG